jgi:DNA-binding response OmpR family regulator
MKILIVEDKQEICSLLEEHMNSLGHEINTCTTAEAALEAYQQALYSLVVLDLDLPDMDGLELCRRIRALPQGNLCIILIITDRDTLGDLRAAFEAGADNYLVKPVSVELLKIRLLTLEGELYRLFQRNQALKALKQSLDQIERAKQEWEATADSMSSVVCLLDSRGYVVRANRTIEHWNLGNVLHVKGQEAHTLFHSNCSDPDCYLKVFLRQAWGKITQGESDECEVEDDILQRHLRIQIRPISECKGKKIKKTDSFAVFVVNDITERKQTENVLLHQKNLLKGVANATNSLLVEPDFHAGINKALEILGIATHVDRVYILKAHPHPETSEPVMSRFFEWTHDPDKQQIENPELQNLPYDKGFTRWYSRLSNNKTICGLVRDFPAPEQKVLKSQQILSTLVVPITINGHLWGCIGFDDCHTERQWQEEEETILFATATSIGGALAHKQTEERLDQTGSELRAVFQSLPDEYFRLSVDGSILDYKIEQDSESGLSKTFLAKWASGLLPDDIESQLDAAIAQVLKTKRPATVKYWIPMSGENRHYEELRVFPFLENQVLIVVRDMTNWASN